MNLIMNPAITMTSLELVELINEHRKSQAEAAGQTFPSKGFAKLEHADLMKKVPLVLGGNAGNFSGIYQDARNRDQECYRFPKREACLIAMSYSYELQAAVFDRMTALEQRPMTQAELIAASANHLVAIERQQDEQRQVLARVESTQAAQAQQLDNLSQSRVWDHCPQNCWSLSGAKAAMNERHGLSGPIVDFVLKQWQHLPNPAGMVKNSHEDAQGSQYMVWSKTNVTAAFKRFVDGCQMVTPTQAMHPDIEGRFKLRLKEAV